MENNKSRTSIRQRVLFFSVILFSLILICGSVVFIIFYGKIVQENTSHELVQAIEIERIRLEASVNAEIAIALKMADSPIIQEYFAYPENPGLEQIAFREIAGYRRAFAGNSVFWVNDIDHRFFSDDAYSFTVDINSPDNYWYIMTLRETEKYNFNINYNPDLDMTALWINAPVFDSSRKPIGILGTGIDLTRFVESIYRHYKGKAALYLFNSSGEITGARDQHLVSVKTIMEDHLGNTGKEIFEKAGNVGANEFLSFESSIGVVAVSQVPALGWYITAIQPVGIMDILGSSMTLLFLFMIAVIAGIFITFYIFIAQMIKPMKIMVETLDHIAVDWDLTQRLHLHRQDEIGTVGEFFNTTFEKIRELFVDIKGRTATLSGTGDELDKFTKITRGYIDGINENMQDMQKQVLSQSDMVNSAVASMERIIKGIGNLDENITIQAENVSQSSSAIEEMLANIQSVTQTLVKNTNNINSLAKSSNEGRNDLQKVSNDIKEIAQESEGLLEINSVMQNIASQTNLLSMNAAIEAAHAGESGKGFAVVADEIRKLAENSSKQSKTIIGILKKIKSMIDAITKSTTVVLERFITIEGEIQTVSDQESQIRNAMEEQGYGSKQILDAVTRLNSVTDQVRRSSADMTTESKDVLKQSSSLKSITMKVADDMDNVSQETDNISGAFTRVQNISNENRDNINALSKGIARFKVE